MSSKHNNRVVIFYPDPLPKGKLYIENMAPVSALCAVRLIDRSRFDVKIMSRNICGDDYIEKILSSCQDAVVFGVSAFIGYQLQQGLEVTRAVKKRFPKLPVVWGGWFPSSAPDLTIADADIDMVVIKQGEETLRDIVEALYANASLEGILGLYYKNQGGAVVRNAPNRFIDLNELPPIPYDLLEGVNTVYNVDGYRTMDYMTSYGCPHRCSFCCEPAVNKQKWSGLSPRRIVNDLKYLRDNYGVQAVSLLDTNTFVNVERIREFCKLYIQENLDVRFAMTCGKISHLIKFDDELWGLIAKANITRIQIGVEGGKQEYLVAMQKDNRIEDAPVIFRKADKYGIKLVVSTIIGIPGFNIDEEFEANINVINTVLKISKRNIFAMYLYTPLPATSLLPSAEKHGFCSPVTLEEWSRFDFNINSAPWIPKRYREITERIQFYFKYLLVDDFVRATPSPILRKAYRLLYLILHPLVCWRFRRKAFYFPVEYYLAKGLITLGKIVQKTLDRMRLWRDDL